MAFIIVYKNSLCYSWYYIACAGRSFNILKKVSTDINNGNKINTQKAEKFYVLLEFHLIVDQKTSSINQSLGIVILITRTGAWQKINGLIDWLLIGCRRQLFRIDWKWKFIWNNEANDESFCLLCTFDKGFENWKLMWLYVTKIYNLKSSNIVRKNI